MGVLELAVGAVLVVLVLVGVTLVVLRPALAGPAEVEADAAALGLGEGPLGADDVAAVRFPVVLRGYRMADVDRVLERLAEELAQRPCEPRPEPGSPGPGRDPKPGPDPDPERADPDPDPPAA